MKKLLLVIILIFPIILLGQEICNNGIDDDGDGLIDLFDDECECEGFSSTQSVPSLIPNYSFESNSCCPSGYSQLNCADTWQQASGNTSDYFNTCGFNDPLNANPYPLPGGGNGYGGFIDGYSNATYKEYIGACLTSPMVAGNQYSLSLYVAQAAGDNSFNFSIYGSNDCSNLPFGGICPTAGWDVLANIPVTFTAVGQWQLVTFTFIPTQDINAIVFGGDCNPHPLSGSGPYNYYYIDEMVLAETSLFSSIEVTPNGGWCTNDLSLTASTDTSGGTWQWYKDSIAIVGETNPILNISSNNYGIGEYTIKLTIGNKCETTTYNVEIPDFPIASFEFDSVCRNSTTSFSDLSTIASGTISSWEWDFDDGNLNTNASPTHTFVNDGTYDVQLITTSDIGCRDTINESVTVYPNPLTSYTVDDVCLNEPSVFVNSSAINTPDNITTYNWSFGDGNTSILENPNHIYATEGTFNVKLILESNNGCLDSMLTTTRVNPKPTAAYNVNDDCVNIAAQFTDNSTISSGNITNWEWDFDDASPYDFNQNPSHFYTSDGLYNPTLIVTSDFGCKDTIELITNRHAIPDVNFSALPVCQYDSMNFINNTTINAPSTITNWIWNFGDGSPFSAFESPNHKYNQSGVYNVSLIASTSFGCVGDVTLPIQVYPIPTATFFNTSVCENKPPMYFIDVSSVNNGSITNWEWNFGDGNSSTFQVPSNAYSTAGVYDVQLIVTSNNNCVDTVEIPVTVDPKPIAEFIPDISEGCSPVCVNYTDNSLSNASSIIEWQWNLGNGEGSFDQSPATCYENNSNTDDVEYNVSLIVKNDLGCYDTIAETNLITSWHNPLADFEATPNETNMYEGEVETFNYSLGGLTYSWDFDNRDTSDLFEPTTHYSDTGTYNITLIVATENGCIDTVIKPITITPIASIYIPNTFTPNGDGTNDGFIYYGFGIDESTTEFYIFDRWGALIYYTENGTPWDGMYKNELAIQDSYVYKLVCKDVLGETHEYLGHFILLR